MRIGINMPFRRADGNALTVRELMDHAAMIERLGYDGIWIGDTVGRWNSSGIDTMVGSSRVDLQACKLEYSIVSPK